MKKFHTVSLLLASLVLSVAGATHAQGTGQSREMVKMDRNTFLSMYNFNSYTNEWTLKSGMLPPQGVKSREEIISMRDEFLSMNVWNEYASAFEPVKDGKRRDMMSTVMRDQLQREALMFNMTHRFDEAMSVWVKIRK